MTRFIELHPRNTWSVSPEVFSYLRAEGKTRWSSTASNRDKTMHLARIIMQLKGMERKGDIDEATFKHLVRFLAEKFIEQQTVDVVNQEIETNIDQVLDNHLFKPLAEVMLR